MLVTLKPDSVANKREAEFIMSRVGARRLEPNKIDRSADTRQDKTGDKVASEPQPADR